MKKLARPFCTEHFCQGLVTHLGDRSLLLTFLPKMSQQHSDQSFLAGIEKLVN